VGRWGQWKWWGRWRRSPPRAKTFAGDAGERTTLPRIPNWSYGKGGKGREEIATQWFLKACAYDLDGWFLRYASGQTNRQTRWSQYFAPLPGGRGRRNYETYRADSTDYWSLVCTKLYVRNDSFCVCDGWCYAAGKWKCVDWLAILIVLAVALTFTLIVIAVGFVVYLRRYRPQTRFIYLPLFHQNGSTKEKERKT